MNVPPEYAPWFESLGFIEINFGSGGIKLFSPAELEEAQVGYSRSAEGDSFCDGAPGSWKPEWLVIACETGLGDPIFIDALAPGQPVMTALHGEEAWEPRVIARSLVDFAVVLRAFKQISQGREYPVALERNPLSQAERERTLRFIGDAHGNQIDMDFWNAMVDG